MFLLASSSLSRILAFNFMITSWYAAAEPLWLTSDCTKLQTPGKLLPHQNHSVCKRCTLTFQFPEMQKTWTQSMNIHWLYIGWVMFQPVKARHSSGRQKQSMLLQPSPGDFGCWKLVARRNMWNPWNSRSRPEVFSPLCSSLKFLFCLFFNAHYNMIFMLFIQVCCCFDCFTLLYYHILVSYNSEATSFSAICALSDETGPTFKIPTRLELGKASWSGSS